MRDSAVLGRRKLLIRSCQAASAALVRAGLGGLAPPASRPANAQAAPSVGGEFHLHPRYREQAPLDAALARTKAGLDDFVAEKHHDRIAAALADWSAGL